MFCDNHRTYGETAKKSFDRAFESSYVLGKQEKDAEGGEMLSCNKGVVQALYLDTLKYAPNLERWKGIKWTLTHLFGSKCLPDGVAVEENATTSNVDSSEPNVDSLDGNVESLEPKPSEPRETFTDKRKSQSRNLSQNIANCDKVVDNILKGSLLKERRLNIAAMVMQGIVANQDITRYLSDLGHENAVAAQAILYADALIDVCESLKK